MRGGKKRPTSIAPSSQFAFSPPGWLLWELRRVVGVSAHGERTSVLQGQNHALPRSYVMDR